jgi:outer membrane protein
MVISQRTSRLRGLSFALAILSGLFPTAGLSRGLGQQGQKPAQAPVKNPNQEQLDTSVITRPLAASPPVGPERTGVDLNQVENLTLQDAIRLALINNLTIEQFRQAVQMSQYALFSSRGVYDLTSGANINLLNQSSPTGEIDSVSGGVNGAFTQRIFTYNFTTNQAFEPTGGSWTVAFNNQRITTSSSVSLLTPEYSPSLNVSVLQPLMRNLSVDANRHNIQVAKEALTLSDSQFRQQVIQIINQVQDAYWELVFAIRNDRIARNTYDLTHQQLEDNKKQVEAGTLAPLDLRQTEAQLESNKGTIIAAKQTITTDENALKQLLLKDPNDKMWNSVVKPVDDPQFETPTFSVSESIALALKNRPELEQYRLLALKNQIDANYFKNQMKPQLDFQAGYLTAGLAGAPSNGLLEPATAGGFDQFTQHLINNLNAALTQLGLKTFNPKVPSATPPVLLSVLVPPEFNGGYLSSLGQLFSQDFRTIQFGTVASFPWKNRTAKGNYLQARAAARQTDALERQEIEQIEVDVRNALQAVDAARESYQAAVAGRQAALAQYVGEQEKFRAGLSSTYLVLQQETAYANAQGTEVRALTNYSEALANFQRVTGTTLISNNIDIPPTSQPPAQNQSPTPTPSPGSASPNKPPATPTSTSN